MDTVKQLLLPDPQTKKRSLILSHPSLVGFAILLIGMIVINQVFVASLNIPSVLGYATNISVSDLLTDTNKIRASAGLNRLTLNDKLSSAAYDKSQDMFAKDYWAHNSPDGKEPWDFIIASGYDYLYAGENLAVDFSDSDEVVQAWYESPSHRDNLLNANYTEIGFAVANGKLEGRDTTLVVQMFGHPRFAPALSSSDQNSIEEPVELAQVSTPVVISQPDVNTGAVLNAAAVFSASRYIAIILGLFLSLLFAVDWYYIKSLGVDRVSGHTLFHILLLLLVIAGVWYTNIGLVL